MDDEDSNNDPEEYSVEAIRQKRRTRAGTYEYLIKWANYPEEDNTWEPLENLKCPELIQKFNEAEADKRRLRKASQQPASKRLRRETSSLSASTQSSEHTVNDLFVEIDDDEDDSSDDAARKKNKHTNDKDASHAIDQSIPKGFERGLAVDRILHASYGEDDKLYFFVKWQGINDVEMVEADQVEKNAPYELCRWYRERLFFVDRRNPNGTQ